MSTFDLIPVSLLLLILLHERLGAPWTIARRLNALNRLLRKSDETRWPDVN